MISVLIYFLWTISSVKNEEMKVMNLTKHFYTEDTITVTSAFFATIRQSLLTNDIQLKIVISEDAQYLIVRRISQKLPVNKHTTYCGTLKIGVLLMKLDNDNYFFQNDLLEYSFNTVEKSESHSLMKIDSDKKFMMIFSPSKRCLTTYSTTLNITGLVVYKAFENSTCGAARISARLKNETVCIDNYVDTDMKHLVTMAGILLEEPKTWDNIRLVLIIIGALCIFIFFITIISYFVNRLLMGVYVKTSFPSEQGIHFQKSGNHKIVRKRKQFPSEENIEMGYSNDNQVLLQKNKSDGNLGNGNKATLETDEKLTRLHIACKTKELKLIESLINDGHEIDPKDVWGKTPLFYAAEVGDVESVRILVREKAVVNIRDALDKTPLHYACISTNLDCVQILIEAKADVNAKDNRQQSPLHIACQKGHPDLVSLLVKSKADKEALDISSKTPLYYAVVNRKPECVKKLREAEADFLKKYEDERTLLHYAAEAGNEESIELLIEAGIDVNTTDKINKTALHSACEQGTSKCVEILIKKGADVNLTDMFGKTPLHFSAIKNDTESVKALLKAGANKDAKDKMNKIPKDYALDNFHRECITLLSDKPKSLSDDNTGTYSIENQSQSFDD